MRALSIKNRYPADRGGDRRRMRRRGAARTEGRGPRAHHARGDACNRNTVHRRARERGDAVRWWQRIRTARPWPAPARPPSRATTPRSRVSVPMERSRRLAAGTAQITASLTAGGVTKTGTTTVTARVAPANAGCRTGDRIPAGDRGRAGGRRGDLDVWIHSPRRLVHNRRSAG